MVTLPDEKTRSQHDTSPWLFREPTIEDGLEIHTLIANSPPLDTNSAYCNFLQCTHFSSTSIVAHNNSEIHGFISAYLKPSDSSTLFIWQVAVSFEARGQGLAFKMLNNLVDRFALTALETTITRNNVPSWSLFKKFDFANSGKGKVSVFIDHEYDFKGVHDTEYLYHIPLSS